jgi:hypothetical protein
VGNCYFIVLDLVQAPNNYSEDRNFDNGVAIKGVLKLTAIMRQIREKQKPTQEKNLPVKQNNQNRTGKK